MPILVSLLPTASDYCIDFPFLSYLLSVSALMDPSISYMPLTPTVNSTGNHIKTVSKFHITKAFFPLEALLCLLTYIYANSLCSEAVVTVTIFALVLPVD